MTPFEAGKSAKELGIDVTKTFVLLDDFKSGTHHPIGSRLELTEKYNPESHYAYFTDGNLTQTVYWSELAYYEPKEEYVPQVGDRVSVEGEVTYLSDGRKICQVRVNGFLIAFTFSQLTLLSRPTPKKSMTLAEIEAALGYRVNIIDKPE